MHFGEVQTLRDNRPEEVLEFSVYCDTYRSDIAAVSGLVAHGDSTRFVFDPVAASSQVKAQYAEVARQVASGASGPFVDSASQGIVHGGGGPTLGANAAAPLLVSSETRARPAAYKDNDPAAFSAPPIVEIPDAVF